SLQPGSDDIVFFIYSGHGFRFDNQTSKYPCFDLTTSQYDDVEDDNYLQMSDIYNEICGKEARLNIVLSDCCNTPIGVEAPYREVGTLFSRSSNNYSVKRLGQLFLQARGSLISTAASPGETSVCDMTGGYFTLSFIRSLRKEINAVNQQSVSWENIINNTIAAARQRGQEVGNRQQGLKLIKIRQ
ncbi:caspase family protein, partial [Bacteroides heparinolyticus]